MSLILIVGRMQICNWFQINDMSICDWLNFSTNRNNFIDKCKEENKDREL